jgi:hypothetical protein
VRWGGIEFLYQPVESGFELGLVLVGTGAEEVDDLAVVIGGLLVVATSLVDHSQSIVSVVDFGEAHEKIPCRLFGDVEFAVVDHIDDGVGCGGEFIGVIVTKGVTAKIAMSMIVVVMMVGSGGESLGGGLEESSALGTLILLKAAALVFSSAATVARIVASDLRFGHRGSILPSWSEEVEQTIEEILRDTRF